jgi:hypothetical protein
MLSSKAYADRKWAPFPALRRVLEGKPLESDQEQPFDRLVRLSEVATLALERRADVWEAARAVGMREVHTDIDRLVSELHDIVGWFAHLERQVCELHDVVERLERPGSPE